MVKKFGNIYLIATISVIGGGLFGFDISSMSAVIGTQQYLCYFNQLGVDEDGKCKGPIDYVQGGVVASMAAGSWGGALISGFVSDILGRRYAIMVGAVIWCVGSIIVCASQNLGMLTVGRVINGLAVGIESAQVPVYISEIAPPSKRGRLVGAQQWAITWGIMIMFYISYGASFADGPTASFRIPWGLQMIPAVVLFCGMIFLPESPRWMARKDRWEECHEILTLVHGKGDPDAPFVQRELQEIKEMCEFERQNSDVSYLELFKPKMINRTHIGIFTQIWSQLTGMNVMMYYITYVFAMAGLTGDNLLLSSSIQYIINVVMTVPALLFIDRWGRRPTLLAGAALMMTWLFANAGLMATYGHHVPEGVNGVKAASWKVEGPPSKAVIACTYLFVASFAPTWGPVSWIYPPELFPLRVRGKAVALTTSANWAFNFALGFFVPPAFVNIQWEVYILFGVFCVCMFIHVLFMFPETAGKTLEEVEDMFTDPSGPKYIGTPAWKTRVVTRQVLLAEKGQVDPDSVMGYHTRGSVDAKNDEETAIGNKATATATEPAATTTATEPTEKVA